MMEVLWFVRKALDKILAFVEKNLESYPWLIKLAVPFYFAGLAIIISLMIVVMAIFFIGAAIEVWLILLRVRPDFYLLPFFSERRDEKLEEHRLQNQINQVCSTYGLRLLPRCKVYIVRWSFLISIGGAFSIPLSSMILLPATWLNIFDDEVMWFVTLHELGHCVHNHLFAFWKNQDKEMEADEFATRICGTEISMLSLMSLSHYCRDQSLQSVATSLKQRADALRSTL